MLKQLLLVAAASLPLSAQAADFKLSSPDVKAGGKIANKFVYKGFGCEGENVSPALAWSGAPEGTKSFALTVYDPDAPTGSGWWHWVVYNIPASASGLPGGAGTVNGTGLPSGSSQGRTDFGTTGWGGPCPPQGDKPHHYVFTLHALKVDKLDVDPNATAALIGFMIHANEIGKAKFTSLYSR